MGGCVFILRVSLSLIDPSSLCTIFADNERREAAEGANSSRPGYLEGHPRSGRWGRRVPPPSTPNTHWIPYFRSRGPVLRHLGEIFPRLSDVCQSLCGIIVCSPCVFDLHYIVERSIVSTRLHLHTNIIILFYKLTNFYYN